MPDSHGRFVWYDLLTTDTAAAIAFYTEVVGWTAAPWEDKPYTMWTPPDGAPIGGVGELPAPAKAMGAPPNWMAHLSVPDLKASLASVLQHGGKHAMNEILTIPEVGQMTLVTDPFGAMFWIFQPAGHMEAPVGHPKVGHVSWAELTTDDVDKVWDFYHAVFGWTKTETMDMGPMGEYRMFSQAPGAATSGGMMKRPPQMPVNAWLYYFRVADLDASIAKAKALGGTLLHGPHEVPGGDHVAQLMDPQGAAFALHSANR